MVYQHVKYKVASDKSGTAGYDNVNKNLPPGKKYRISLKLYDVYESLSVYKPIR